MAHCGSPAAREVDCALGVLADVAAGESCAEYAERRRRVKAQCASKPTSSAGAYANAHGTLRSFSAFLKALLVEDLRGLHERQLRVLFTLVFQCSCTVKEDHEGDRGRAASSSSSSSSSSSGGVGGKENRPCNASVRTAAVVAPRWALHPPDDVMILLKKCSASTELKVRLWPAWKCDERVEGPLSPDTPTPLSRNSRYILHAHKRCIVYVLLFLISSRGCCWPLLPAAAHRDHRLCGLPGAVAGLPRVPRRGRRGGGPRCRRPCHRCGRGRGGGRGGGGGGRPRASESWVHFGGVGTDDDGDGRGAGVADRDRRTQLRDRERLGRRRRGGGRGGVSHAAGACPRPGWPAWTTGRALIQARCPARTPQVRPRSSSLRPPPRSSFDHHLIHVACGIRLCHPRSTARRTRKGSPSC